MVADPVREAVHRQRAGQIDGIGAHHQNHQRDSQRRQELGVAADMGMPISPRQCNAAVDRGRIAEHREERQHGRNSRQGRYRHDQGDGLQPQQTAPFGAVEQFPNVEQQTHADLLEWRR